MINPDDTQAESRMAANVECPCCKAGDLQIFHSVSGVPTNSCILFDTEREALEWPRGDIELGFCSKCGFVSNVAFDPKLTEYSGRYEETQAFSTTFNAFHERLASEIIQRHGVHNKQVIEIGCGKGEFLNLLCSLGDNKGLGFDPGYSETRGRAMGEGRFEVVKDFFSAKYADREADLVCCKMTLEHIHTPHDFVSVAVRVARRPNGIVFIQVPESKRILQDCAFEDIYYEHCSYFTAGSLSRLFESLGFDIVNIEITYGDQYLTVEAAPRGGKVSNQEGGKDDLAELTRLVASFPQRFKARIDEWNSRLADWAENDKSVVLWGSGSKAVAFLASVADPGVVSNAVDINPYRKGYFMPGTGQKILSPEELPELGPDVVIVMNRVYVDEIKDTLAGLGLSPEVYAL